jgi:hypothetical protein
MRTYLCYRSQESEESVDVCSGHGLLGSKRQTITTMSSCSVYNASDSQDTLQEERTSVIEHDTSECQEPIQR